MANELCENLPINEIALVDEPTAAGVNLNIPLGSKIMIIDIGGSTTDMCVIKTQGGEGKSLLLPELLKFKGKMLVQYQNKNKMCWNNQQNGIKSRRKDRSVDS